MRSTMYLVFRNCFDLCGLICSSHAKCLGDISSIKTIMSIGPFNSLLRNRHNSNNIKTEWLEELEACTVET